MKTKAYVKSFKRGIISGGNCTAFSLVTGLVFFLMNPNDFYLIIKYVLLIFKRCKVNRATL